MPTNRKISELSAIGTPARTNVFTMLDALGANVRGAISSWLALTTDADLQLSDVTTNNVSIAQHGFAPKLPPGSTGYLNNGSYLQFRDEKTQNTSGGTFTSGSWQTRTLNAEVSDVGGYGALSGNQITLAAGTYLLRATAPAHFVNRHQVRLQNVTDGTTVLIGTSEFVDPVNSGTQTRSEVSGLFTVGASKALELQHQCQTTKATDGLGLAANFTTEVFAVVELWRLG